MWLKGAKGGKSGDVTRQGSWGDALDFSDLGPWLRRVALDAGATTWKRPKAGE